MAAGGVGKGRRNPGELRRGLAGWWKVGQVKVKGD